jgi:hypothetical protein
MKDKISRRSALFMLAAALAPVPVSADDLPSRFQSDATFDRFDWLLPALKSFLGESTGDYISRDVLVALGYAPQLGPDGSVYLYDQFAGFFYSPPETRIIMPHGTRLLESPFPHMALQSAMAITEGNSRRILAAALLVYATPNSRREDKRSLVIFEPSSQPAAVSVKDDLTHWVRREIRKQEVRFAGQPFAGLQVETASSLKVHVVSLQ